MGENPITRIKKSSIEFSSFARKANSVLKSVRDFCAFVWVSITRVRRILRDAHARATSYRPLWMTFPMQLQPQQLSIKIRLRSLISIYNAHIVHRYWRVETAIIYHIMWRAELHGHTISLFSIGLAEVKIISLFWHWNNQCRLVIYRQKNVRYFPFSILKL